MDFKIDLTITVTYYSKAEFLMVYKVTGNLIKFKVNVYLYKNYKKFFSPAIWIYKINIYLNEISLGVNYVLKPL